MLFELTKSSGHSTWNKEESPVIGNSKVEKRSIRGRQVWSIEINSIEELVEFQKEIGEELIVTECEIEIYDDFRE